MKAINRCEFLTTLKFGSRVYVKGDVLYPPLPDDVVSEIALQSNHIKVYYDEDLDSSEPIEDTTSQDSAVTEDKPKPSKRIRKKK